MTSERRFAREARDERLVEVFLAAIDGLSDREAGSKVELSHERIRQLRTGNWVRFTAATKRALLSYIEWVAWSPLSDFEPSYIEGSRWHMKYEREGREIQRREADAVLTEFGVPYPDFDSMEGRPYPKKSVHGISTDNGWKESAPAWASAVLCEELADLQRLVVRALARDSELDRGLRHIPLRDIDLAAGAGAVVDQEDVVGHLAFRADWLKRRGIDASQASIVRVTGRSMEPTLLEGSSVLVDETRRRRRAGEIFAVRSLDGGVLKRLEKDDRGRWLLVSDNPRYDPVPWGPDDELVGQVRWTARAL